MNEALAVGWRKRRAVDEKEATTEDSNSNETNEAHEVCRTSIGRNCWNTQQPLAYCVPASLPSCLFLDFMSGFAERPALSEKSQSFEILAEDYYTTSKPAASSLAT